ncbi:ovostatin-like [Pollicipes pollicipes]|uniref:ovostatin-like n=1 Tax=Pollicipes pollicipes TaxID=41117 RepID=UPI0018854256|nr:ovostatin-like [Pollicipes pollicipes]
MASAVRSGPRLALLALLVVSAAEGYIDRGFLLTAPKVLIANTVERFCLTFFNLRDKASVSVYLLPKKNSTVDDSVAQLSRTFYVSGPSDENVCFDFTVPKKAPSNAYLRATVRSGFFSSSQQSRLRVLPFTLVTLVQTDKSKYKAGDLVQFRVVTLKSDLTAMEEVVDQIFITTPGGTRLAQFDKVATRSGIIQKKFQLTEEPPL